MSTNTVRLSKFLSLVLRHKPEEIGLELDENGWANVDDLIRLANQTGRPLTRPLLEAIVAENDKKRFAFNDDQTLIRASQGHSVEVDLALPSSEPPALLFHGTAATSIASIRESGLHSGNRQHVHLSIDSATAHQVGQRHGRPVVLTIEAGKLAEAGHLFYLSDNHVWLTDRVPVEFIHFPDAP